MPRPPRRVPSKKAAVSKGRVSKLPAKAPSRPSTSGKRKSLDAIRQARQASDEGSEDNEPAPPAQKKKRVSGGLNKKEYSHVNLVARKKRILVEEIDAKWVAPSEASVAELSKILRDVGRAVMQDTQFKTTAKRDQAQQILEKSYQRFDRTLARLKIPPGSSEKVFNNEWLISEEAKINGLIQPESRQVTLLQKEISRQRRLLEDEERQLTTLQKNAKADREVHRQKALKFVPALKAPPMDPDQLQLEIDKIRLNTDKSDDATVAQDLLDEGDDELGPTMRQLEKTLTAMAKNRQTLKDMPDWIRSTRAAVDDVLYNLKGENYGDLMDMSV